MNMFKFEFKRLLKGCLIWSMICAVLIVLFLCMFPSMSNMGISELVGTKLEAMPESLLKAFNISNMTNFSDLSDFSAYVLQYIVMAGAVYASIIGVSSLSKEEGEGTIEFLYSKPVTRNKIVFSKLCASVLIFYIFVMICGITSMVMAVIVKQDSVKTIDVIMDIKTMFIGMSFVGYIFMSIGFFISSFIKSSKQAVSVAIGIFFTSYVIGIFSKLKDSLENLIFLSPFDYANVSKIITSGFDTKFIIAGCIIIVACIAGTFVLYNKKDYNI